MNNEYLLLLDNSFKENYCYYSTEQELVELNHKWNLVLESISVQLSDFEDKDFEFIDIPFCMFEAIGFGSFNKELSSEKQQILARCFPNASDLLIPQSEFEESHEEVIKKYLDDNFVKTFNKLFEFYKNEADPEEIVEKIREKKQKKLHPNVEALNKELEKWELY